MKDNPNPTVKCTLETTLWVWTCIFLQQVLHFSTTLPSALLSSLQMGKVRMPICVWPYFARGTFSMPSASKKSTVSDLVHIYESALQFFSSSSAIATTPFLMGIWMSGCNKVMLKMRNMCVRVKCWWKARGTCRWLSAIRLESVWCGVQHCWKLQAQIVWLWIDLIR